MKLKKQKTCHKKIRETFRNKTPKKKKKKIQAKIPDYNSVLIFQTSAAIFFRYGNPATARNQR